MKNNKARLVREEERRRIIALATEKLRAARLTIREKEQVITTAVLLGSNTWLGNRIDELRRARREEKEALAILEKNKAKIKGDQPCQA